MTKREEWDRMIKKVENDDYTTDDILQFLEKNKPKPKESRKKLPCVCGCKAIRSWWHITEHKFFCQCDNCERQAPGARAEIKAIRNWNEMIEKEKENKDNGSEN